MTATNHALTGAVIGLSVGNAWLALVLALGSHFVCDVLPHYGNESVSSGSKEFRTYLIVDCLGAVGVALFLFVLRPEQWFVACWCAFAATSPDLMWLKGFLSSQKGFERTIPNYLLAQFHAKIQWFQRPIGVVFESIWALAMIIAIDNLFKF
jgi:hypothetical protein